LSITVGAVSVQMLHCGQKLVVSGRDAVVHGCFAAGRLPRPEKATSPEAFSETEDEAWRMVATSTTSQEFAEVDDHPGGPGLRPLGLERHPQGRLLSIPPRASASP
jgi:hypothetical protein